jgi:hypothetical protein
VSKALTDEDRAPHPGVNKGSTGTAALERDLIANAGKVDLNRLKGITNSPVQQQQFVEPLEVSPPPPESFVDVYDEEFPSDFFVPAVASGFADGYEKGFAAGYEASEKENDKILERVARAFAAAKE